MTMPCGTHPWPPEFTAFHPRKWLTNGHAQTIVGNFLPRPDNLPPAVAELVEVSPAHGSQISSQVLCECHWQPLPDRASRPTAIILHGLEGSSRSQYVIGNSNKLWNAGCNIIRMNMRNCGIPGYDMMRLTPTLYHSGMSSDVEHVMRFFLQRESLTSIAFIGYSMGGNLMLKLAGDLGINAPPQLRSIIGVSPVIDLDDSSAALHEWQNRIYERKFVRALLKRFRHKAMLFPRAFDPHRAAGISSLRDFDEHIIALYSGFQSASDYYYRVASARVLDKITVPTLVLHACDDPFIRLSDESRTILAAYPNITLLETEHGGHCAFLAEPDRASGNDGYWAEHTAMRFLLAHA